MGRILVAPDAEREDFGVLDEFAGEVVVLGDTLYWCKEEGLARMNKAGGGVQVLKTSISDSLNHPGCRRFSIADGTATVLGWNEAHDPADASFYTIDLANFTTAVPIPFVEMGNPILTHPDGWIYVDPDTSEAFTFLRYDFDQAPTAIYSHPRNFSTEGVTFLAVVNDWLYYQTCENGLKFCSLARVPVDGGDPVPFTAYTRVDRMTAAVDESGVVYVNSGGVVSKVDDPEAEAETLWVTPSEPQRPPTGMTLTNDGYLAWVQDYAVWALKLSSE